MLITYKHILNYKNHSPNSIIYSEEYLSNGLKDASHFIKNMNNLFEIQIRKILFKTNRPLAKVKITSI